MNEHLVHTFDGRVGGAFRISFSCDAPDRAGKTTAHTDTYHGRFVTLVPGELVVETFPMYRTGQGYLATSTCRLAQNTHPCR